MIKSSMPPMETIHESGQSRPKMAVMPWSGSPDEAALFSVVKHNQSSQLSQLQPAPLIIPTRSASLNMPVTRKASHGVRGWVKRSNSSGMSNAAGLSSSESLKGQIKHLGGGRLEEAAAESTVSHAGPLALPAARRPQRSRTSSTDSRATQWLDFYPTTQESHPLPESLSLARGRESDAGLRPLPLRLPSLERSPPSKTLTRKNSKWKPLPTLPYLPLRVLDKQPNADMGDVHAEQARVQDGLERNRQHTPEKQDEGAFPPVIRYGTPPPTPDSSTEGAARVRRVKSKEEDRGHDIDRKEQPHQQQAETHTSIRHTRQERIWLHLNYRGEAPFLQAWGLNIADLADRLEGLSILRDLMQAEEDRKGAAGEDGNNGML